MSSNSKAKSPPVEASGSERDTSNAIDLLVQSKAALQGHIDAIQAGKQAAGIGQPVGQRNPILDCINALPEIVRSLDAGQFEIEAAFESYEDSLQAALRAQPSGEARVAPVGVRVLDRAGLDQATTPGHPDAFLNVLLDYTAGFYGAARDAGMPATKVADAMHHIERAARGLHRLALGGRHSGGEESIGHNITFSPFDLDSGNAVVSPQEPDGPYWTLIAQGGETEQNAIATEIVRRLNTTPARAEAQSDDTPCTDCGDTGVTYQTERQCACEGRAEALDEGAADAWRIRTKESLHGEGEPAGRWIVSNILSLSSDTAHWYEVQPLRASAPSPKDLDAMTAYGVAVARPSPPPAADEDRVRVIAEIEAERSRQIEIEGWTTEHDDEHSKGEMAKAAGCYAIGSATVGWNSPGIGRHDEFRRAWPWAAKWWKPKDRRSDLIRAGALIVAEIERRDRAALKSTAVGQAEL